jgi:murein DD-endopeptidase MepM/ murein hydrolase activator NlpD
MSERHRWWGWAAALILAPITTLHTAVAQIDASSQPAEAPFLQILAAARTVFSAAPLQSDVQRPYGRVTDPRTGGLAWHRGVDYRAPDGTPIVAPGDGLVTRTEANLPGYGMLLEIDHGGGLLSRYAHLSACDVKVGQKIRAGQMIARVGHSGDTDPVDPHLHFEVVTISLNPGEDYFIDPQLALLERAAH